MKGKLKGKFAVAYLYNAILDLCEGYEAHEVGPAVGSFAIDTARACGMDKETFLKMLGNTWDYLDEKKEKEETH